MSIRDMRIGDTIIGNNGKQYRVEVKSYDRVKAREIDLPRRLKTFTDEDDIFCVDFDDGIWQQTQ
jgi:hypothetical protein